MGIKIGTSSIDDIKLGTTQVDKVMLNGKNLFNNNATPIYTNTASAEAIPTGVRVSVITSSGTNRTAIYKIMDTADHIGETFTLTTNMSASGSNNAYVYIGLAAADGSNRSSKASLSESGSISYTIEEDENRPILVVAFYATRNNTGQVGDYCDYTNIQFEKGSTPTTYEPYIGEVTLWQKSS